MNIEELNSDTLLDYYRNASITGGSCGGHHKAYQNDRLLEGYKAELKKRSLPIPMWNENQGRFNGPGAY
jgi:hypothetical protein